MPNMSNNIDDLFASALVECGGNLSELARRMGCSRQTIHNLSVGRSRSRPRLETMVRLGAVCGIDSADVVRNWLEAKDQVA